MSNKIFRERTKNEATGVRAVSQYVQEFWECGWQEFDQRNDYGIDGQIILKKKGIDLGVKINIQIKCGKGYISSIDENEIKISIHDPIKLIEHIKYWKNQIEPAVLIFVNPYKKLKTNNKEWVEDRLNPDIWWVNLKDKNLRPEGSLTLISLPIKQTFGEHSKGDFLSLAKKSIENKDLQEIIANNLSNKIYNSLDIRKNARDFFVEWKKEANAYSKAINNQVIISKTAWRHILKQRRGIDRQNLSLRLLAVAKQIMEEVDEYYILSNKENEFEVTKYIGLRAFVKMKYGVNLAVQVVLLQRIKKNTRKSKIWFYSIHHRN